MFPPLRRIALPPAGWRPALNFFIDHGGLLICLLFLLAGLATAGDYGINQDDPIQRAIARANLDYILGRADYHGLLAPPADAAAPRLIPSDRYYGVAWELPLLLAEGLLGPAADYYQIHRLRLTLNHLLFIVGAFFCYRLACRMFNSRPIAILALLLYLLHPRIYAQSFLNSKDPAFLTLLVIALYLLERAFRKDTAAAFILLGAAVGILTNLRIVGLMLIPAVLAMRGLDWRYAAGRPAQQKAILRTAALFALAAALTCYTLTPYAWTNPLGYLAASLNLTINHPNVVRQLFQGATLLSNELPPHYLPVWFAITTPPLIMLLGFVGLAVVAVKTLRRPAVAFRNGPLRFQLLLLAAFLLPPLAAALLGSIIYSGWRHFYFVYGPFCLLAALGGGWLLLSLSRRRLWRLGIGGLAALGLGLLALQLTQLHPLQYVYFNFLVDRATPEYLRTQYDMDYWELAQRDALQRLLARHPRETLTVRAKRRQLETLPERAGQRLLLASGRNADYELIYRQEPHQPDLAFNSAYRRRFYNNTLITARPTAAARMSDDAIAAYQEIYRQATANEPIIRAGYDVYLNDKRLTFVRANCPPDSRDAWLGVRLFPHRLATLPPTVYNPGSYATFGNHRVRIGDLCLAVIQLPAYAQGDLILMQRNLGNFGPGGEPLWQELHSLSQPALNDLLTHGRRQPQSPAAPIPNLTTGQAAANPIPLILNPVAGQAAAFEVFLDRADGRHRLLYAKANCTDADYATPIFLHIAPVDLADLPPYSQGSSFENRDFPIDYYGGRPGGDCLAVVPLPEYPIASIRTGQFVAGQGELWAAELTLEP